MKELGLKKGHHTRQSPPESITGDMTSMMLWYSPLPFLLHWGDRDSLAHGVESRMPFLDHRVVEFSAGLPWEFKIEGAITKRILREAAKNHLPEEVRLRTNKGMMGPGEENWVRRQHPDLVRKMVKDAIAQSGGIITDKALEKVDRQIQGKDKFNFLAWRIISFGRWIEIFDVAH